MEKEHFAPEVHHQKIQRQILESFYQNRLPHAYLFYGSEGSGKDAFAIALAQLLNAGNSDGQIDTSSPQYLKISNLQHPDIKFIFPTPAKTNLKDNEFMEALRNKANNPYSRVAFPNKNTFIGIDTVRELKKEASFKLYEGRKKIFIISEAHKMRLEAANALLKLLEEPPENLMLILITANIFKILPTIKSRCQIIRFGKLTESEICSVIKKYGSVDESTLSLLIRLSGFNIKRTLEFLGQDVLSMRDQTVEFLRKIILIHRSQELMDIIEPIATPKNREAARLTLWFLLLWFQDILHLQKIGSDNNNLFNIDKKETLEKFMAFVPNADIQGIVWDVETARQQLADVRNFNPLLILTTLAIKLNTKLSNNRG